MNFLENSQTLLKAYCTLRKMNVKKLYFCLREADLDVLTVERRPEFLVEASIDIFNLVII